ncbi:MAG: T9SS type A sorting domain-containing protein [Bacteroidales bacterium]|nr:T9SS type A sorting domain-containing protein [Bacteroidales bacterium]
MKKEFLLLVFLFAVSYLGWGQTNPTAQSLPYTQDFSGLAWTSTTYLTGWQGWTISTSPSSSFNTSAPTADRALVASSTAATSSGNVHNYNGTIGFLNTGSLDLTIVLALNTTNLSNVLVSYKIATMRNPYDGGSNTRINEVTLQYRVGTTGVFTNLTGIEYQNNTTTQTGTVTTPQNQVTKSINLPSACNNQSVVQIRWASRQVSGGGSRPSFCVDDISAKGAPSTQSSIIVFSNVVSSQLDLNWTDGNGSKRAVFVKQANTGTAAPVDNTTYAPSLTYGSGDQAGSGWYCVFNGTTHASGITVTGLSATTDYIAMVCEYNGSAGLEIYNSNSATDNPKYTTTGSEGSPTITLTGSLTPFAATLVGSTSTEQNYTVAGSYLTNDISIAPPSGFEISTGTGGGFSPTNPITLTKDGGGNVATTTIYARFAPVAAQAYSGNITHTSFGAVTQNQTVSGTGILPEPTNHVTNFLTDKGTPTYSVIEGVWNDATGGTIPDGYLVKASTVSYVDIVDPVDGTPESDGTLVKNIAKTVEFVSFTGLTPNTTYYFKIFPYTNSGSNINYKTDGTVPTSSTATDVKPLLTYTWNVSSGNWNTAASWTPSRTTAYSDDVLVFDGSLQATPSVTIDFTSPQTVGRFRIINNAAVTFATNDVTRTLNIGYTGMASPQLEIESGSSLTVSASNGFTINVLTGFTGSIYGNMTFTNAAHKLTAVDVSGITFNSGAIFTAGTSFSSNPFGSSGTANSVVFGNGSTFLQIAGSNPFALGQPSSIVVFQTGSLFKLMGALTPSVSGRVYADFELDHSGPAITMSGTASISMNNLTITNGSLNFNMTGTPGHSIKGNIIVNDTLSFNPASAGTVTLNGSATQTISGTGTVSTGTNSTIAIDNNTVADRDITFGGMLTVNSGKTFTINSGKSITVSGNTTINQAEGLVIKSDATGTGSFMCNGTISGAGTAKVERYITGYTGDNNGWHLLACPVSSFTVLGSTFQPVSGNDDLYWYDEIYNLWMNWIAGNFDFGIDRGYMCSYKTTTPKYFTGTLNNANNTIANVSFTPLQGNGWHLIPNPFPCGITWNSLGMSDLGYESTASGKVLNGGRSYSDISDGGVIPAMNAFFMQVKSGTNSLTIPASARTHSSTWYKSTGDALLMLTAQSAENTTYQENIIRFNNNATEGFDPQYDSPFLPGASVVPQMCSYLTDNTQLSLNTYPALTTSRVVPLEFIKGESNNYSINVTKLDNFSNDVSISLEDTKTNITQDLRESPVYTFSSSEGDNPKRFNLHFGAPNGVNEIDGNIPVRIYSSNNIIYLSNNTGVSLKGEVFVYNLMGQQMMQTKLSEGVLTKINLNAPTGYYLVKVITDQKAYSGKIFIR